MPTRDGRNSFFKVKLVFKVQLLVNIPTEATSSLFLSIEIK